MNHIADEIHNLNPYIDIFVDDFAANKFLLKHHVLRNEVTCRKCNSKMHSLLESFYKGFFIWKNYKCKNKKKLNAESLFEGSKVEYFKILRVIYCYVFDYNLYQAVNFCQLSKPTFLKIKYIITFNLELLNQKIGGEDLEVQLDETAICNGMIITNPSNILDDKKGFNGLLEELTILQTKIFFYIWPKIGKKKP